MSQKEQEGQQVFWMPLGFISPPPAASADQAPQLPPQPARPTPKMASAFSRRDLVTHKWEIPLRLVVDIRVTKGKAVWSSSQLTPLHRHQTS